METRTTIVPGAHPIASAVRCRIDQGGERLWRLADFADLPSSAVAQSLSRLARQGLIERLSKGIYYRSRETAFGNSRPNPTTIQKLADRHATVFPSGMAAANLLGFTTQTSHKTEISTSAGSLPRKLVGDEAIVHTGRPTAWAKLSKIDAAILEFLRTRGEMSELSPADTIARVLSLFSEQGHFEVIMKVASTEPPRVRAMLGAIGEELGKDLTCLAQLRNSLNPFSRFDFGMLRGLSHARKWQAKERP